LEPDRFLNAVFEWIRKQYAEQGEEGQQRWEQFVTWLTTPPLGALTAPVGPAEAPVALPPGLDPAAFTPAAWNAYADTLDGG
jgi:hypothetical protein